MASADRLRVDASSRSRSLAAVASSRAFSHAALRTPATSTATIFARVRFLMHVPHTVRYGNVPKKTHLARANCVVA